jgi:endonuclease YncB( thermonuclease family)
VGTLRLHGTLAVKQFWPSGNSDADTCNIQIAGANSAFQYKAHANDAWKTTLVLESAEVHGRGDRHPLVKNGIVRVRLHGIDAPELHVSPSLSEEQKAALSPAQQAQWEALEKAEFRQHWAQSCASKLHGFLSTTNQPVLECEVTCRGNEPSDVFDGYGRMIGNVHVKVNGQLHDINYWVVKEGWAFPSFYDSMTLEAINPILNAWAIGLKKSPVGKALSSIVGELDFKLVTEHGNGTYKSGSDKGPVLYPKLFRRLVNWSVQKRLGILNDSFFDFVAKGAEKWKLMADYRADPNTQNSHDLTELITQTGTVMLDPASVVFVADRSSKVMKNGQVVRDWF